jgi:hypothetical protein
MFQDGERHVDRERCGDEDDREQRHRVHDAGDRTGRAGAQVGDGARDRSGRRDAAEERRHDVGDALRHQLLVRIVPPPRRHAVGDARAQQRLDGAEERDRHRRNEQALHARPVEVGPDDRRQRARDAAEAGADRLDGQGEPRRDDRERDEGDDRARDARRRAHRAPRVLGAEQRALVPRQLGEDRVRRQRREPAPEQEPREADEAERDRGGIDLAEMGRDRVRLREEVGRHLLDPQAEQVLQLRDGDQHRDAVGEADDDRDRDRAHDRAELQPAEHEQQDAGEDGRDHQPGDAVALHDAVDDDDEGARRPADLHARAPERRDQHAGDDRGEEALLGLDAARDRERHRERQRDDPDGDAGAEVGSEAAAVVAFLDVVDDARPKAVQARRELAHEAGDAARDAGVGPCRAARRARHVVAHASSDRPVSRSRTASGARAGSARSAVSIMNVCSSMCWPPIAACRTWSL